MKILLVLGVVVLVAGIAVLLRACLGAYYLLKDTAKEFRSERELLDLQKQIVTSISTQISLQKMIIEKQLAMAANGITAMKLLQEREQDPKWMDRFNEGRDNAQYN